MVLGLTIEVRCPPHTRAPSDQGGPLRRVASTEGLCFTHPKRADSGERMNAMSQFRVERNRHGGMWIYCRELGRLERCVCMRQWNCSTGAWE